MGTRMDGWEDDHDGQPQYWGSARGTAPPVMRDTGQGERVLPPLGRKVNYTFFLLSLIHLFGEDFFAFGSYEEALGAYGGDDRLLESRLERGVLEWRNGLLYWATARGKLKEATKWGLEHFLRRLKWQEAPLRPTPRAYGNYWRGFYEASAWLCVQQPPDFIRAHGYAAEMPPGSDWSFPGLPAGATVRPEGAEKLEGEEIGGQEGQGDFMEVEQPVGPPRPQELNADLMLDAATNNALDAITTSWYGVDFNTYTSL